MNIPSWIIAIVGVLSLLNTAVVAWAIWSIKRIAEREAKDALMPVSMEITEIETRLTRIEGSIEHLPTAEEHQDLAMQMARMNGDMRVLTEQLKGASELFTRLEHQVNRMDGFLLRGGVK